MTVKERLKRTIQAWGRAPRGLTWSFWFLLIINVFFLAGLCSDHWLESSIVLSGYDHRSQGLWRFCYGTQGTTCCGYINEVMYIEPFLHATRAFLVMSLIPQFLCLCAVLKGIQSSTYSDYKHSGGVAAGFSAFFITLAIIIYGGASQDEQSTSLYSLSWSYALCVLSGLAYIPFTCFIFCTSDDPEEDESSNTVRQR